MDPEDTFLAVLMLTALIGSAGYTTPRTPDLERLYASTAQADLRQPPIVLIHGIMGSRLRDSRSGQEAWTGGPGRLLLADYNELALPVTADPSSPPPAQLVPSSIHERSAARGPDHCRHSATV